MARSGEQDIIVNGVARTIKLTTEGAKTETLRDLVRQCRDVGGDAAECGVFQGGSLRVIASELPNKRVLGFDTFAGLPQEAWREGEPHKVGDFSEVVLDQVRANVADLSNVMLVAGIFPGSAAGFSHRTFAFAYLDFDYYESTRAAIAWFMPRMSPRSIILFDDYEWRMCPGVKQAIDEAGLVIERTPFFQAIWRAPR